MDHYGSGNNDDLLPGITCALDERSGLLDCSLYLTLGRNTVAHERKRQTVPLFRFRNHANSAHADYNLVARLDIAKFAAPCLPVTHHNQRIHPLVLDLDESTATSNVRAMVGRGIEIFR